jgi:dihydroxy-acid dehydratase
VILKALLDAGHLHGDCLTITGETLSQALKEIPKPDGSSTHAMRRWRLRAVSPY